MRRTIKQSEHVFIAGKTGSGKTFLAKNYLAGYPNVIALDTKGTLTWKEGGDVKEFEHLNDLMQFQEGHAIYRPSFEELNEDYYEAFFKWIYFRQNTIVWVDEVMSVCQNSQNIPTYYKAILTRGRERNTSVWSLTQRPKTIPLVIISEATHFFVFRLNIEADRQRIAEIAGSDKFLINPPKYDFWYYNTEMDEPIMARLVYKNK